MTDFPSHITFKSDNTEVSLKEILKGTKEPMAEYRYCKVNPLGILKDSIVTLGMVQIQRLLDCKLIEIE
jgi:hypothetical protein